MIHDDPQALHDSHGYERLMASAACVVLRNPDMIPPGWDHVNAPRDARQELQVLQAQRAWCERTVAPFVEGDSASRRSSLPSLFPPRHALVQLHGHIMLAAIVKMP